jgi:hypothetical protein
MQVTNFQNHSRIKDKFEIGSLPQFKLQCSFHPLMSTLLHDKNMHKNIQNCYDHSPISFCSEMSGIPIANFRGGREDAQDVVRC